MKVLNLKKKYPFKCTCGHEELHVAPSLFMTSFLHNIGAVNCPGCDKRISVEINEDNTALVPSSNPIDGSSAGLLLPESCYREATKEEEETIHERATTKNS